MTEPRKWTDEQIAYIQENIKNGVKQIALAKEFNISPTSLRRLLDRHKKRQSKIVINILDMKMIKNLKILAKMHNCDVNTIAYALLTDAISEAMSEQQ